MISENKTAFSVRHSHQPIKTNEICLEKNKDDNVKNQLKSKVFPRRFLIIYQQYPRDVLLSCTDPVRCCWGSFTCEVVGHIGFLVRVEMTDLTKPQIKPSVIVTYAHSSSKDWNEKSHNLQKFSSAVQW